MSDSPLTKFLVLVVKLYAIGIVAVGAWVAWRVYG